MYSVCLCGCVCMCLCVRDYYCDRRPTGWISERRAGRCVTTVNAAAVDVAKKEVLTSPSCYSQVFSSLSVCVLMRLAVASGFAGPVRGAAAGAGDRTNTADAERRTHKATQRTDTATDGRARAGMLLSRCDIRTLFVLFCCHL